MRSSSVEPVNEKTGPRRPRGPTPPEEILTSLPEPAFGILDLDLEGSELLGAFAVSGRLVHRGCVWKPLLGGFQPLPIFGGE